MSHVHTLATPEVGSTLHEQEMSCHSQSLLLYHCHKWAQLHHTVLRWCYLPVDWIEVAALALTKHDPSTCGIHLLHPLNNNDCLTWALAQDYYNLQNWEIFHPFLNEIERLHKEEYLRIKISLYVHLLTMKFQGLTHWPLQETNI